MGLEAYDPDMLRASQGQDVVTPSGMQLTGSIDAIDAPPVASPTQDGDGDGVVDEVPTSLVDDMEFYLLNYFKPAVLDTTPGFAHGLLKFHQAGCATCHIQSLRVNRDRRVADVATVPDPQNGVFNGLFATATARFTTTLDQPPHPPLKTPAGQPFLVDYFFSDLKRHDLGPNFWERSFDGTITKLHVTEPLWGVGTTAPYGHDGRSINLNEVILRHGGEAQAARDDYAKLSDPNKQAILSFLSSLVLFPPDDTASNLDPGDRTQPLFPQRGHGSIKLGVLFNDPTDPE